ncbi:MAG: alpha/beta hydrolase [Chitinophagia bacterium]|nr:alpha/beta hydrolase [Chitinophagia bacterium]
MKNTVQYPYAVHYAELGNETTMAYMDEGSGPHTLVFVHGLANYAPVWHKNIEGLRKHFRCVAVDLPGNGLSDRNEHRFSMMFFACCLKEFIDQLGLKNVSLVGHSMGGQIAITTTLMFPNHVQNLFLLAPAGLEAFSPLEKTMYYTTLHFMDYLTQEESNLRRTMESSFYQIPTQGAEMINELIRLLRKDNMHYYRKMIDACIKSMLENEVYSLLPKIEQPTHVFFGLQDALIPNKLIHHTDVAKMATDAIKKMRQAELHLFAHCGHFVQWEKATEVNKIIAEFLIGA